MDLSKFNSSKYQGQIREAVMACESMRTSDRPVDISLSEYFESQETPVSMTELYEDLGIDTNFDTIQNIMTLPKDGPRWLVPEIIRDAIKLGLRSTPIYPDLIAGEQTISQQSVTMPSINMSEAVPKMVGEAETIQTGSISYGQKTVKVFKMGRGIKISDEVARYCSLNVVALFLQDFGIKLGQGLDTMAIKVLINGEQADGSESAPVVGIKTPNTLVYRDLLKVWVRMSRLGKNPNTMVAGEEMAIDILDLPEFKNRQSGTTVADINVKTPIPNSSNLFVHGNVPANQVIVLDPRTTMIKFNATPLLIESERIVSNQTAATYASLSTGFAIIYRDSRIIIDRTLDFATNGFPPYMNVDSAANVIIS